MITALLAMQDYMSWYVDVRTNTVADSVFQCLAAKGHPNVAGTLVDVPYDEIVECVGQGLGV